MIGRGAISGFVNFVACGELLHAEIQRSGTTTLFTEGEQAGIPPPPVIASATLAGLTSSGPDHPALLAKGRLTRHLVRGETARTPKCPEENATMTAELASQLKLWRGAAKFCSS